MILAHHHKKPKNKGAWQITILFHYPHVWTLHFCSVKLETSQEVRAIILKHHQFSHKKRTEIDYSTWTLNLYLGKERKKRALIRLCRIELETLNERSRAALLLWWWYTLGSNFTMANIQPRSKWYILIISRPYWRRIYRVVWTTRIEHFAFLKK